ncbi:hypothetical protein CK203_097494 [Vitis vinifera]|uniref:Uncharacterized protein n=1 Tax=Vitis vinifera TaxID=29760 RepID=A0A438D951_VITVI|nr:hypothetical protein CK203_097494 [Vitis vinifera]
MDLMIVLAVFVSLLAHPLPLGAHPTKPISRIAIVGAVFCDICSNNTLSRHSYFLPGVEVQIQCKLRVNSARTNEEINFSVNRTTGKHGVYKLEIPSVDGIDCIGGHTMQTLCQARLIGSSSSACNVPGLKTTTNAISVKSKQDNLCIFNLNALSYRPSKRNTTICGDQTQELPNDLNAAKFFLPCFPPFGFPWPSLPPLPPLPQLPPLPRLPPLPTLPFPFSPLPPFPSLPFPPLPFKTPPSLPFPFPPTPPLSLPPPPPPAFNWETPEHPKTWAPYIPSLTPPPPPAFNLGDPKTWTPYIPSLNPPPPAFNLGDPKTWTPYIPSLNPPPPAFNWEDPRTWIPYYYPPSPPTSPQNQHP